MKKHFLLNLAVIIGLLFIVGFQTDKEWLTYSSTEGHFSIKFPGSPEESTDDQKTEAGNQFKIHYATFSPSDDEVYMAGWIDMTSFYPEEKSIEQMLEDSRDGATGSMKATNVKTLAIVESGNPYIEFTFETDDFTGKDRIYLINKFQYSIITIFSKKSGIKPTADKFITSFKSLL